MRVVEIAKLIGITSQELREEFNKTDFGVKATDKIVSDALASGIIRMMRVKYKDRTPKIEIKSETEEKEKKTEPKKEAIKKVSSSGKIHQTIDSIKFIKTKPLEKFEKRQKIYETLEKEKELKKQEKEDTKGSKKTEKSKMKEVKIGKNTIKSKEKKSETQIIESIALQKEKPSAKAYPKSKKRVKITHKLTLDKIDKQQDLATLVEIKYEEEKERELLKSQKKRKAKSQPYEKKEEKIQEQIKAKSGVIEIPNTITLKEFAEKTGIQIPKIISELMKNGILATINQVIDFDTASIVATELGIQIKKKLKEAKTEDLISGDLAKLLADEPENLKSRPPVVTILGHVDHGKTTLLDSIRKSNITKGESGGITQHIGAYQIDHEGKKITFIDTPGHEAFTEMRARGAKITDIAILVVAADEGMKPQTMEALNHAKEANVPIIVAINKIDKEGANIDKVKGELAEHDLTPEDWGGKTIIVPLSAKEGTGIVQLLEMILLVSEIDDFKANPNRPAVGVVIESKLDPNLGPTASIIIKTGTLNPMDNIVVGETIGRIKLLMNDKGDYIKNLTPSGVARISGLNDVPQAGDVLQSFKNEKQAKKKLNDIINAKLTGNKTGEKQIMQKIISNIQAGKLESLKIVLKVDTKGSLEAITQNINKIKNDEVIPKIIHAGVGHISESDIMMAAASEGVVIGFHTKMNNHVRRIAEKEKVDVKLYKVIYELTDDIKKILSGLLKPEIVEKITGHAEIKEIFLTKKSKMIVGCLVKDGEVLAKSKIRVQRDEEIIGEGMIGNLKRINENVKKVKEGDECGIEYEGKIKLQKGDILEGYMMEEIIKTL